MARETTYGVLIRADGTVEKLKVPGKDSISWMQQQVGGYVEVLHLKHIFSDLIMLVDEEGRMKGLTKNELAMWTYLDYIVGPALLMWEVKVKEERYITGMPEVAANYIIYEMKRKKATMEAFLKEMEEVADNV